MGHKTEKEDAVSVPEKNTITLCVNCGVATSTNNNNSCQKCLNSCSSTNINHLHVEKSSVTIYTTSPPRENTISIPVLPMLSITKRVVNRCAGCRKKVGLTGFKCRCGDTFCSDHRYSDRHDCNYDYKAAGREVIKRENPVVKADKIVRI